MLWEVNELKKIFTILGMSIFFMISFSGCGSALSTESTPEQLYSDDHSIDMFVYEDAAYVNVTDVDWVKNETFEKDKYIGKISNTGVTNDFNNWDATLLAIGTESYESDNNQILLASLGEKFVPYMKYVEG